MESSDMENALAYQEQIVIYNNKSFYNNLCPRSKTREEHFKVLHSEGSCEISGANVIKLFTAVSYDFS